MKYQVSPVWRLFGTPVLTGQAGTGGLFPDETAESLAGKEDGSSGEKDYQPH